MKINGINLDTFKDYMESAYGNTPYESMGKRVYNEVLKDNDCPDTDNIEQLVAFAESKNADDNILNFLELGWALYASRKSQVIVSGWMD